MCVAPVRKRETRDAQGSHIYIYIHLIHPSPHRSMTAKISGSVGSEEGAMPSESARSFGPVDGVWCCVCVVEGLVWELGFGGRGDGVCVVGCVCRLRIGV